MRLVLLSALAALSAAPLLAHDSWGDDCDQHGWSRRASACVIVERSLPAGHAPLEVDASPNGGIRVLPGSGSEVKVRALVRAAGDTREAAKARAAQVRIVDSPVLHAEVPADFDDWSVSFELRVPADTRLVLRAVNGGLHLENVRVDAKLDTKNGGIHLEGTTGHVVGRTQNGGVHVGLPHGRFDGEGMDLATTNGGIHWQVPADASARLYSTTQNGGMHVEGEDRRGHGRDRRDRERTLDMEIGGGGPTLKAVTINGGVHLDRD